MAERAALFGPKIGYRLAPEAKLSSAPTAALYHPDQPPPAHATEPVLLLESKVATVPLAKALV